MVRLIISNWCAPLFAYLSPDAPFLLCITERPGYMLTASSVDRQDIYGEL